MLGAFPEVRGDRDRVVVQPLDGGHVGEVAFDALLDGDAADADVRRARGIAAGASLGAARFERRRPHRESALISSRVTPRSIAMRSHAALLQAADQRPDRVGLRHRRVVDDDFVADEADHDASGSRPCSS